MKRTVLILALLLVAPMPLSGCEALDGLTRSTVTGEKSSPEEIQRALIAKGTEFKNRRVELTAEVERLNNEEAAVLQIGQSEMQSGADERQRLNDIVSGGVDLVGTVTKIAFPQAAGAVDLVTPLVRQGLALAGIGGLAGVVGLRTGTKKGAATVTAGIATAADRDPQFKAAILNGPAGVELSREFRKAPKAVKQAIEENKVA